MLALADTSAWGKRHLLPTDRRNWFDEAARGGALATCAAVTSELLYTARSGAEFRRLRSDLAALPSCPITSLEWDVAFDTWQLFADEGAAHHRRVKFVDCLIAAAAQSAGVAVLHYDRDFDAIAAYTGQDVQALAPLGSL